MKGDIASVSPETKVNLVEIALDDPWDFGEVYAGLYDWAKAYRFDPEREPEVVAMLTQASREVSGQLGCTSFPLDTAEARPR